MKEPSAIIRKHVDERRAKFVREKIEAAAAKINLAPLELAKFLSEARSQDYANVWKDKNGQVFGTWENYVAQANLGIGKRNAYYYAKIWDLSEQLTIPEERLEAAGMSKLKVIFTLDPEQFQEEIRDLVDRAPEMTVEDVQDEVKVLKEDTEPDFSWINAPVLKEDKEEYYKPAVELVRQVAGQTIDITSQSGKDLSEGACIVHMAQQFLLDPNNAAAGAAMCPHCGEAINKPSEGGDFQDCIAIGELPDDAPEAE